jgi:hypothetical protein
MTTTISDRRVSRFLLPPDLYHARMTVTGEDEVPGTSADDGRPDVDVIDPSAVGLETEPAATLEDSPEDRDSDGRDDPGTLDAASDAPHGKDETENHWGRVLGVLAIGVLAAAALGAIHGTRETAVVLAFVLSTAALAILVYRQWARKIVRWLLGLAGVAAVSGLVLMATGPRHQRRTTPTESSPAAESADSPSVDPASSSPLPSPSASPRPLPAPAYVEAVINQGDTHVFYKGEVRVGVPNVFDSWASLTVATALSECRGNPRVGASLVREAAPDRWYRVIVMTLINGKSVTVRVTPMVDDTGAQGDICLS